MKITSSDLFLLQSTYIANPLIGSTREVRTVPTGSFLRPVSKCSLVISNKASDIGFLVDCDFRAIISKIHHHAEIVIDWCSSFLEKHTFIFFFIKISFSPRQYPIRSCTWRSNRIPAATDNAPVGSADSDHPDRTSPHDFASVISYTPRGSLSKSTNCAFPKRLFSPHPQWYWASLKHKIPFEATKKHHWQAEAQRQIQATDFQTNKDL